VNFSSLGLNYTVERVRFAGGVWNGGRCRGSIITSAVGGTEKLPSYWCYQQCALGRRHSNRRILHYQGIACLLDCILSTEYGARLSELFCAILCAVES